MWSHRSCTCSVPSQAAASLPLLPGTQSSLCTFKELGSTFPTAHRHRAQRGSAFTADAQLRISLPESAGRACPALGAWVSVVRLSHYLRPPGRDFSDYRESPVNLIRFGPQARKGASVKRAPASLLLRICGLCGHRCAAQGELGVFQDKIFTARSQRNAQITWILPVNICWDVYALGRSVRKLCRIGLWCSRAYFANCTKFVVQKRHDQCAQCICDRAESVMCRVSLCGVKSSEK